MMFRATLVLALLLTWTTPASAQVDTDPPGASTDSISTLASLRFRFDEDVRGVTSDNVTVGVADPAAVVAGIRRCLSAGGATVSCLNGLVRTVVFLPSVPLVTGETYETKVNPEGVATPVVDTAGNAAPAYRRLLRAPSIAQESVPGARYRWRKVAASGAGGGVYVTERRAGARVVYRFSGTWVSWVTVLGPNQGIAGIYIDNRRIATIDTGSPGWRYRVARTVRGLSDRAHTLVVRVDGRSGKGRSTWVAVDGFRSASGGLVDETAGTYLWPFRADRYASGRALATSSSPGAVMDMVFRGRGVDWITTTGPDQGIAKVYIDNKVVRTFDNYSPVKRYGVRRTITNLADGQHRISIAVTSSRNRRSRGTTINVDAFVLRAAVIDFRRMGAWLDRFDYSDTCGLVGGNPCRSFTDAAAYFKSLGVRTLYIQTGHHKSGAFRWPTGAGAWLRAAHAQGIKVVGWYLPRYDEPLGTEVANTAAIATFRSGGHRFDGLGIDIEDRTDPDTNTHLTRSAFFAGITKHLRLVRSRVGLSYPVAAITFAPLDMDLWPGGWDGFPWSSVARYADVAMPMSYWSNRYARCAGTGSFEVDTRYCVEDYTRQNIRRTRRLTGLPVHIIGGVMTNATASHVRTFVDVSIAERAYGASLYDARSTTDPAEWAEMKRANQL